MMVVIRYITSTSFTYLLTQHEIDSKYLLVEMIRP